MAHWPSVSSTGVENAPFSSTSTVSPAGGVALASGAALDGGAVATPGAAPSQAALTVTLDALVVVPSTGIAPFSYVVPSTGWLMLSVGAWIARNGTVIRIVRGDSADLPVSGFVAVTSNWLLPRRRSTSALHEPSAAAVARYGWATP